MPSWIVIAIDALFPGSPLQTDCLLDWGSFPMGPCLLLVVCQQVQGDVNRFIVQYFSDQGDIQVGYPGDGFFGQSVFSGIADQEYHGFVAAFPATFLPNFFCGCHGNLPTSF